jgi:hypothetical protein
MQKRRRNERNANESSEEEPVAGSSKSRLILRTKRYKTLKEISQFGYESTTDNPEAIGDDEEDEDYDDSNPDTGNPDDDTMRNDKSVDSTY